MLRDLVERVEFLRSQAATARARRDDSYLRRDLKGVAEIEKTAGDLFIRADLYGRRATAAFAKSEKDALAFLYDELGILYTGVEITDGVVKYRGGANIEIDEVGTALRLLVQGADEEAKK